MLSLIRRVFGAAPTADPNEPTPAMVAADPVVQVGSQVLDLREGADVHEGLPHPDWSRVSQWLEGLPDAEQAGAWLACERAWLLQLRDALGEGYRLHESDRAFLLSAQESGPAQATLRFLGATERRVKAMLEDLAASADLGKEILVVFEDEDDYYRYVSYFYPSEGEFAMSSGMFLHAGCAHFVVHGEELANFEPVIVHEMTHSQLAHLPIPAWLNEGMAVNAEQRLTRIGADVWSVQQLEAAHRKFWTPETIQEFWSGAAYKRPDQGSELAYDLGRLIVNGLSSDWAGFKRFALAADLSDSGARAAHEQLDLDLGLVVRQFLGRSDGGWAPDPDRWPQDPERGQF
jgi:hypothetical protein